jgi:hypothetical protein
VGLGGRKPLINTGALMKEFTGTPMNYVRVSNDSAEFGSRSDLARWHSRGTRMHGGQHIPPRPILYSVPTLQEGVSKLFRSHIVGHKPKVD